jgi:hypothetical protein
MTDRMSHDPAAPHAGHDLLLVAAHVAGDTTGVEAARGRELIAGCGECRDLAVDLAALRTVARQLPPPQRSRDFRLSPETAARLRVRSPWRQVVEGVTSPRGFGRPLAATLMTLGLAGLMVSATPLGAPLAGTFATRENAERALAPSDVGSGYSGGSASEAASPSVAPGGRTPQDSASGGGAVDTAKGAPGGPSASASPDIPPAAIMAGPSGAEDQAATPGPTNAGPGQGPVTSSDGLRASASPGALVANGNAAGARDATTPSGWAGPSPLALLSAAFLLAGLGILVARRHASSRPV